ncbi:MAG: pyridoxal-phosphate dependent enzyme [Rhodospirillales bacterium]|nr:pyridoxal-phosphate dependent enzyme [Rhodospirillales bacterium]
MTKRLPPKGDHQPDLFAANFADIPIRDQRDTMERPFFSLAKKPRFAPIEYHVGDVWVEVSANPKFGIATIWDADILIWASTQITEALDRGQTPSRVVRFHPHNLLKSIRRATGGEHYKRLRAALERLTHTAVRTNIRAEGKKTLGLELAEQLGWRVPDAIIYPTGGGTGIVGMWKAFAELEAMGLIGPKRPKMFVVQAEDCAPIVRAFEAGARHAELWPNARTIAAGLRVPVAIGDYLILDAVRESGGAAITVSETELLDGMRLLASREGLFASPESGAAAIGAKKLRDLGVLSASDETVIFSTGSGLMHTDVMTAEFPVVDPDATNLPV